MHLLEFNFPHLKIPRIFVYFRTFKSFPLHISQFLANPNSLCVLTLELSSSQTWYTRQNAMTER